MNLKQSPRRAFIQKITGSLAALGLLSIPKAMQAAPSLYDAATGLGDDDLFKKLKGKHKIVFDVPHPNEVFPFAWPLIYLMTNEKTGTPMKDSNAVVVLRHEGIGYAFDDRIWGKYNFGTAFKANDPRTKKTATVNPFWNTKLGDYSVPGVGAIPIGIKDLQASGVKFVVCDMAMTVYSAALANGMKPEDVKKDWMSGLLPDITVVPSGVWALGRAQENGCGYIFAG